MAKNCTVVGVKKSVTGKGRDFYNYFFNVPFSDYESENADCLGMTVQSEGSYKDFSVKPGDVVQLSYEKGYQDKAVLSDIVVVKPFVK